MLVPSRRSVALSRLDSHRKLRKQSYALKLFSSGPLTLVPESVTIAFTTGVVPPARMGAADSTLLSRLA